MEVFATNHYIFIERIKKEMIPFYIIGNSTLLTTISTNTVNLHADSTFTIPESCSIITTAIQPVHNQMDSILWIFLGKLVEASATWFAPLFIIMVLLVVGLIYKTLQKKRVSLQISGMKGDEIRVNQLYMTFISKRNQLQNLLEALPPLWLSTILDVRLDKLFEVPASDPIGVNLKLGPAEVKQIDKLLRTLISRRVIYNIHLMTENGRCFLVMEDSSGLAFYWVLNDFNNELEMVVSNALGLVCIRNEGDKTANQELMVGLLTMSKFFEPPFKIEPLLSASAHFEKAAILPSLRIQAQLLKLCSLQLTQTKPVEIQTRTASLHKDKSIPSRYQQILTYQRALAELYTYKPEGYKKAEILLYDIESPGFLIQIGAWFGILSHKRKLLLHLLAKSYLAIVKAHMIKHSDEQEKSKLSDDIENIMIEVEQKMMKLGYSGLGTTLTEVRRRLLDAKVASACSRKQSDATVIDQAQEALSIAPYALDIKANLGRIFMLAAKNESETTKIEFFMNKSFEIFNDLEKTGWDPGYVHYSLAQLHRIRGDFNQAMIHANMAKDPNIRDVFESLDKEIQLIHTRVQSFD